jgi:hypothetical protein
MSFLAWIDFDQTDRECAHRIMDLFGDEDARDELGIGAIRDALADLMFPGTSTIQTRLRYMLFVPWIYRLAAREPGSGAARAAAARAREIALIGALERGGEAVGVIGSVARGALKRLPSDVYWAGLGTLGIRRFQGGRSACLDLPPGDDIGRVWAPGLPEPDGPFLETTRFRLTRDEADFLTDRLQDAAPTSLFRELARAGVAAECKHVWTHPLIGDWSADNRALAGHAKRFSVLLHGAALLYNLMLSELAVAQAGDGSAWQARAEGYRGRLATWEAEVQRLPLRDWRLDDLWQRCDATRHRVQPRTRRFVVEWLGTRRAGRRRLRGPGNRRAARARAEARQVAVPERRRAPALGRGLGHRAPRLSMERRDRAPEGPRRCRLRPPSTRSSARSTVTSFALHPAMASTVRSRRPIPSTSKRRWSFPRPSPSTPRKAGRRRSTARWRCSRGWSGWPAGSRSTARPDVSRARRRG